MKLKNSYNNAVRANLEVPGALIEIFTLPDDNFAVVPAASDSAGGKAGIGGPSNIPDPVVVPF